MKKVFNILQRISENSHVGEMDGYIQHGDTSCLLHTVAVAYYSMRLAEKLRIPVHKRELIRGALAMKNADRDFKLKSLEKGIIKHHMFPLTPVPPTSREAWLVCLVDKACSLYETFGRHNYRGIDEHWKREFTNLYKELRNNVK